MCATAPPAVRDRPGVRIPHRAQIVKGKRFLADLVPYFPACASLFASDLPSASWFTHAFLQQNSKSLS
jgi:hypothetical protein